MFYWVTHFAIQSSPKGRKVDDEGAGAVLGIVTASWASLLASTLGMQVGFMSRRVGLHDDGGLRVTVPVQSRGCRCSP